MAASWQRLGDAVGCMGIGVNRVRIDPGRLSTPPHSHGASEEIVFVLGGSGFSWQDEQVYELRPGRLRRPPRRPRGAHVAWRGRRARGVDLRHAPADRDRLAPTLAGDPVRLAVGRGAHRRSLGRRGAGGAARVRRSGAAAEEHRQRRGSRGRGRGGGRLRLCRTAARTPRRGCPDRDAARDRARREAQLSRRTAMARKRSSSSFSTARAPAYSGTRSTPCGGGRSWAVRRERVSLTPSAGL